MSQYNMIVVGFIFACVGIMIIAIAASVRNLDPQDHTHVGKCYDRNNNEIVGISCLQHDDNASYQLVVLIGVTLFFVPGIIMVVSGL